jgi:hypothetical protein
MSITQIERTTVDIEKLMDDQVHLVCHCTDDDWAFCGLYLHGEPWKDTEDNSCVMCVLAGEKSVDTCPWGCDCDECAGVV